MIIKLNTPTSIKNQTIKKELDNRDINTLTKLIIKAKEISKGEIG